MRKFKVIVRPGQSAFHLSQQAERVQKLRLEVQEARLIEELHQLQETRRSRKLLKRKS